MIKWPNMFCFAHENPAYKNLELKTAREKFSILAFVMEEPANSNLDKSRFLYAGFHCLTFSSSCFFLLLVFLKQEFLSYK